MKESEVRYLLLLLDLNWDTFISYMRGQTLTEDAAGNRVFFPEDVKRFICQQLCGRIDYDFD